MKKPLTVALVGQPNVGKSLVINAISGAHMKVGNFTGVTVEKAEAFFRRGDQEIQIIDLPGTYSLNDYSIEERVTKQFLEEESYDLIVNVVDSTNLERNLLLTSGLMELGKKIIVALNMSDEADKEGIEIDEVQLSSILGLPCLKISAATKSNIDQLADLIIKTHEAPAKESKRTYGDAIEEELARIEEFIKERQSECLKEWRGSARSVALKLLQKDKALYAFLHDKPLWMELQPLVNESLDRLYLKFESKDVREIFLADAHAFAKGAAMETSRSKPPKAKNYTQVIDSILIHKYLGLPIFLFLMWGLFQLTFELGSIPMDYIEALFGSLGDMVKENIAHEGLASLLADGILGGVGSVLLFLPNILILFFGIALLETTGYMARVAFLLDGFFHKFGMHGKSFIPLVTGFGCSVPAFMAARTLKNEKDRLLTLFIVNFMSCGARLPVYVLFIGAFFPEEVAGNALFGIYILGAVLGLVAAKILRLTAFKGPEEPFVMEMPKYRLPSLRLVWFTIWNKALMYIKKAGTFILAASMLIWFASNYPGNEALEEQFGAQIEQAADNEELVAELEAKLAEAKLEQSYLGRVGQTIEPVFAPMGFDWKMSVALVSGLAAKEVVISTMGVLYSLGGEVDEESETLMEVLQAAVPFPTAIAFILFIMLYNPCLAATVVFGKEAGGTKYIYYLFAFTTVVAYLVALVGYAIAQSL